MTELQKEVVLAMCDNSLNQTKAGRELGYCRPNIGYHIRQIKEQTGLDCRDFYDAMKLLDKIEREGQNG